jgi:hypothetical protein
MNNFINKITTLVISTQNRLAVRRGAGFLEYALIAAVGVILYLALRAFAPDFINGIFDRLQGEVDKR